MKGQWKFLAFVVLIILMTVPAAVPAQASSTVEYTVTFHETGLPNGTVWSVSLEGNTSYSNNATIVFVEPNGGYTFIIGPVKGYVTQPYSYYVYLDGHNVYRLIQWSPQIYNLTFVESGLSLGTIWNVTLDNETLSSTNSTVMFKVKDGVYSYTIPGVNGVDSSIPSGTVVVNGSDVKVLVRFLVMTQFTFLEQGLPPGSHWSVWIDGSYYNSSSGIVTVSLPNGTYSFVVILPSGYGASPATGKVTWSNSLVLITASSPVGYYIATVVLAVAIVLMSAFYIRRKRRLKTGPTKEE